MITKSDYLAHTDPLFKNLELLKLIDMYNLASLKFLYKKKNGMLPQYFYDWQEEAKYSSHTYSMRKRPTIFPHPVHKSFENCLRYSLNHTINSTPENIIAKVDTHSLQGFTKYIKIHHLKMYNVNCTILNCYVCNRSSTPQHINSSTHN